MNCRRGHERLARWLGVGLCCLLAACGAPATPIAEEMPEAMPGEKSAPAVSEAPSLTVTDDVRPAAFAGSWYPDDPDELAAQVDAMLDAVTPVDGEPIGLLVPHAGHVFSGPVAAYGFKQLEGVDYDAVVIIAPNHRDPTFEGVSVWAEGGFETPLGVVPVNEALAAELLGADEHIVFDREVHLEEHAIEIELPFLQRACPDCTVVPVVIGQPSEENIQALSDALVKTLAGRKAVIVASSDMSHYPTYEDAVLVDSATLAAVETGDADLVKERIDELMAIGVPNLETCACGEGPLLAMMQAVRELGSDTVTILRYANSGDSPVGDRNQVVGYGAVMFWHWEPPELGQDDKALLLEVARQAIAEQVGSADVSPPTASEESEPVLQRRSAVFVTLRQDGELRGCIGQTKAVFPLVEAVRVAAVEAAFSDPRFPPLQADELADISIEISVLSPLRRVTNVEKDIQVGTHGLVIVKGGAQGLLLPQVATEQGYDREAFLEALSLKAGLPPDAWQDAGLYTFTAEVFGETD